MKRVPRGRNEQDGNRVSDGDHPRAIPGPEPVDRHRHSGPKYRSPRTCSTGSGKAKPGFAGHTIRRGRWLLSGLFPTTGLSLRKSCLVLVRVTSPAILWNGSVRFGIVRVGA
jgi:hypothetical protein